MANPWDKDYERRALRLLADRATFGLTTAESDELDEALCHARWLAPDSMDTVAAAVQLALIADHLEPLPARLGEKIRLQARRTLSPASRGRQSACPDT